MPMNRLLPRSALAQPLLNSGRLNHNSKFRTLRHFSQAARLAAMKRKASSSPEPSRKVVRTSDYCDVPCARDSNGNQVWPAPEEQIESAREFLRKWFVYHHVSENT